jgi:AAA domain
VSAEPAEIEGVLSEDQFARVENVDFDSLPEEEQRRRNGAASGAALDVSTAREICQLPDPPESDRLVGDLVVRGARTVIGGGTGEGKTTLKLQILSALLGGVECLGIDVPKADGRVLVVDAEQGTRSIKRLLRDAGLEQSDDCDYIRVPDGLSLDSDPAERAAIERQLEQGDYAAVAFDPLYKLHTGDSNDERHAVDLMRVFDAWRTQYHFALLLGCHTRKMPSGLASAANLTISDIFGSGAYTRGAEVVLGIQRVRNGYSRLYFFKDRDGELEVGGRWGLVFDREHGFRRDPKDGEPSTAEKLQALRAADPDLTQAQAAKEIGVTERTIQRHWQAGDEGQQQLLDEAEGAP